MRRLTHHFAFALLTLSATSALAQSDRMWEIRPIAGIAIPTGAQRDVIRDAAFVGAATSMRLTSAFDVVATFAFQSSTAKYTVADNHSQVLVYNVGLERVYRSSATQSSGAWVPFVGGGVGGRAYDYRSLSLSSTACFTGYGNAGVQYAMQRTSVRLEARDNLFCYREPVAPFGRKTRNEIALGLGAGIRF
jgi:hypothetical protein